MNPPGQFQPNLAQALGEGDSSLFKWRAHFNQIRQKVSLGKGDLKFYI